MSSQPSKISFWWKGFFSDWFPVFIAPRAMRYIVKVFLNVGQGRVATLLKGQLVRTPPSSLHNSLPFSFLTLRVGCKVQSLSRSPDDPRFPDSPRSPLPNFQSPIPGCSPIHYWILVKFPTNVSWHIFGKISNRF